MAPKRILADFWCRCLVTSLFFFYTTHWKYLSNLHCLIIVVILVNVELHTLVLKEQIDAFSVMPYYIPPRPSLLGFLCWWINKSCLGSRNFLPITLEFRINVQNSYFILRYSLQDVAIWNTDAVHNIKLKHLHTCLFFQENLTLIHLFKLHVYLEV